MYELMQTISLLLSAYGAWGMATGSVLAKSGTGMVRVEREREPLQFWLVCTIYLFMGQFMFWALRYHLAHG